MSYAHRPSGQPRVIGLTMVKNEQDIIEPMIRHNAVLLDALIVLDNGSVDDTGRIVLSLARELGNVVITECAQFGYTQGERMTRLLLAAQSSYFADFVFFLDADEFIGKTSRAALHEELALIPENGFGAITWHNFVVPDGETIADPPHGFTDRLLAEARPTVKIVLRLDGAFRTDLVVGRGNHSVASQDKTLPGVMLRGLPLWHFPVRSQAQLTAKALVGWLACLAADPNAAAFNLSYHWRGMFNRIVDGAGFSGSDLRILSMHYTDPSYVLGGPQPPDLPVVRDPACIEYVRRYSTGWCLDPLVLVARSWEKSLLLSNNLFTPEECKGGTIDVAPFRFLLAKHQAASVLEIGCETGLGLELFARLGVRDRVGIGERPCGSLMFQQDSYLRHDPAIPFTLGRTYSLVLCLNAMADRSVLIANADRHAEGMILFSLDDPTVASMEAWLTEWGRFGWIPDLMETLAVRCLASCVAFRRGLVVLRRAKEGDTMHAVEELLGVLRRPFREPEAHAGVHHEALLGAAEASWIGYE